jgi:outer membrane murein-binding lipoprotein Lpp
MPWHVAAVVLAGALVAGCASDLPLPHRLTPAAQASQIDRDPGEKTLAGQVLTAIALERVTGRKPDPARFAEAN